MIKIGQKVKRKKEYFTPWWKRHTDINSKKYFEIIDICGNLLKLKDKDGNIIKTMKDRMEVIDKYDKLVERMISNV